MCGVRTTWRMPSSGWSGGSRSPSKWSSPAPERWPVRRASPSPSRSCSAARAELRYTAPGLHRPEPGAAHEAERLGRRRRVHADDVGFGEHLVERGVGGVGGVGVERDHPHPQTLEAPSGGASDRPEADDADGLSGELPGPEPLVGDRPVDEHPVGAQVGVGGDDATGHREEQGHGELGHGIGVASRCSQHRDAPGGRRGDIDVGRVAAGGADGAQRSVEHLALHRVGLGDDHRGAELVDPRGERGWVEQVHRRGVEPGLVVHLAQLAQAIEARAPTGGGDERDRSIAGSPSI